jgi:hypothetical protein
MFVNKTGTVVYALDDTDDALALGLGPPMPCANIFDLEGALAVYKSSSFAEGGHVACGEREGAASLCASVAFARFVSAICSYVCLISGSPFAIIFACLKDCIALSFSCSFKCSRPLFICF